MGDRLNSRQGPATAAVKRPRPGKSSTSNAPDHAQTGTRTSRLLQQTLLAEFGRYALGAEALEPILDKAGATAATGLQSSFAAACEYRSGGEFLEIRSTVGWDATATHGVCLDADAHRLAGEASRTGRPCIWRRSQAGNATLSVQRWNEQGIASAICVPIGHGHRRAFGVLEICSTLDRPFGASETAFLEALAGTLALAIDAQRQRQAAMALALGKDLLVREAHHRIANSLQLLQSLLQVQLRTVASDDAREQIEGAARRIAAVGTLHRRLCETGAGVEADAKDYLGCMLDDLRVLVSGQDRLVTLDMEPFALPMADLTAVGLIVGELVINAIKYGHGTVGVRIRRRSTGIEIAISDDGGGFPPDFDPATSRGLGMRLIVALARNTGGDVVGVDRSVCYGRIVVMTGFGGI